MTTDTETVEADAREKALDDWKTKFERLINPGGKPASKRRLEQEKSLERDRDRARDAERRGRHRRRLEARHAAAHEAKKLAAEQAAREQLIRNTAAIEAITIEAGCLLCGVKLDVESKENRPSRPRRWPELGGVIGSFCRPCVSAVDGKSMDSAVTDRAREARPEFDDYLPTPERALKKWWTWTYAFAVLTARMEGRRDVKPRPNGFGHITHLVR